MIKRIAKSVLVFGLTLLARGVLHRYRPHIVMVTGSVGKTSTKDAVAAVLAKRFLVRKSEKSFNSEFGVPFTILGVENPWSNPLAWVTLARKALALLILPNQYPNMLVLEVGSGKPSDLAQILHIATPDALVVTRLPEIPVHVEFYPSPEAVREEEFSPAYALPATAPLIVSADDPYAILMAARVPARLLTYGLGEARVRLTDIGFWQEEGKIVGMRGLLDIGCPTSDVGHPMSSHGLSVSVRGSVGKTQLLPVAAAIAAALAFDISLEDAIAALASYEPPAGRGRLFAGVAGSTIIDDSYNASPVAVEEALEALAAFPTTGRRIAVLGDMLELGRYSVAEHERVGAHAVKVADILVTVGIRAKGFVGGESIKNVLSFDDSRAAAAALPALIEPGDVVLVKGSQSIRTERIVEALLADRADLPRLCRQESAWRRR